VGVLAVIISQSFRRFSEKKDRRYLLLPISMRRIALLRFLPVLVTMAILIVLFWAGTTKMNPYPFHAIYFETLAVTGFIATALAVVLILFDMQYCLKGNYLKKFLNLFFFLMIVMGYSIFYLLFAVSIPYFKFLRNLEPIQEIFDGFVSSFEGMIIFILLGLSALSFSLFIFHRRKSYLS